MLPHGLVEVVAPWRTSPRDVEVFIAASRDWIDKTLSRLSRHGPAATLALPEAIDLPACDSVWRVEYLPGEPRLSVLREGSSGGRLRVTARDPQARRQLRDWLLRQGRQILPGRVERIAEAVGLRPDAVSVRRQRTRWGSCSARRRISLNCALLFLPRDLVDYLIVHELCHLRHMNHSRRFWSLVESIRPDSPARERALSRAWNRVPGWVFYEA